MFYLLPALTVAALAVVEPAPAPAYRSRPAILRTAAELLDAPDRRVRGTSPHVHQLLAEGLKRSPTFRSLMATLDRADVIVYVEVHRELPASVAGRLLIVPSTGFQRYVRIQLAPGGSLHSQVATLAHELQHAIEVGEAPEVRDALGLEQLYSRIGVTSIKAGSYDTPAAQQTGRRVLLELGS